MAIVDVAYEKWKKDFEAECPGIFKEGFLSAPETALRRDLMRTAYMAGKKSARQPVGEPEIWVSPGQLEEFRNGTSSFGSRIPARVEKGGLFDMPLYAAPPAQAVDLGQFREAVAYAARSADFATHVEIGTKLRELLALIDQHTKESK